LRNLFIGFMREEQRLKKKDLGRSFESDGGGGSLLAPSLGRSSPPPTLEHAPNSSTGSSTAIRGSADSPQHRHTHLYTHSHQSHSHNNSHSTRNGLGGGGGHHSRRFRAR
jgi:hypothetical protein